MHSPLKLMPTCNGAILWHTVMTVYLLAIVFNQILITTGICTSRPISTKLYTNPGRGSGSV